MQKFFLQEVQLGEELLGQGKIYTLVVTILVYVTDVFRQCS